jgi:hypothetical protein
VLGVPGHGWLCGFIALSQACWHSRTIIAMHYIADALSLLTSPRTSFVLSSLSHDGKHEAHRGRPFCTKLLQKSQSVIDAEKLDMSVCHRCREVRHVSLS